MKPYEDLVVLRKAVFNIEAGVDDLRRLAERYPEEVKEIAESLHEPSLNAGGLLEEWEEDQREAEGE